jgi:GNAT superfamily N-acetyltransferase
MLRSYGDLISAGSVQAAYRDGILVGCLVTSRDEDSFTLDVVAVDPQYQGQGIGRHLIDVAERQARDLGYNGTRLCTNARMTENQALYLRLGYEEYARGHEDGYDRVFYRKSFSPE